MLQLALQSIIIAVPGRVRVTPSQAGLHSAALTPHGARRAGPPPRPPAQVRGPGHHDPGPHPPGLLRLGPGPRGAHCIRPHSRAFAGEYALTGGGGYGGEEGGGVQVTTHENGQL